MKINTRTPLLNLKGKEFKNTDQETLTIGEAIANILSSARKGGRMKLYILSKSLIEKEEIELDKADLALIKDCVETSDAYQNNAIYGQILVMFEDAKDSPKSE